MGFTDVSVVWGGALSDEKTFTDDLSQDMLRFIAIVKSEAQASDEPVEIYTLYHDHELSDEDCECIQYETSHLPYWTNGKDFD